MTTTDRRWPVWKVDYFALMGVLGLLAAFIGLFGLTWAFSGGGLF